MSANMSNKDDCYFYFYSTCTKGDNCAFRHCEAALGNETVCTLWQEGRCFRQVCKFRHMEIDKKRSEIPCYWENQLSGCQKANCAFHHTKERFVEGVLMPPNKLYMPKTEVLEEPPQAVPLSLAINKLPAAPTNQLRGVKKMEAAENVPSPTHPPVVINAADDDEDDDDQFSEEGEEMKSSGQPHFTQNANQSVHAIPARKGTPKKDNRMNSLLHVDEGLNYGIQTLEEIKSKKSKMRGFHKTEIIRAPNFLGPSRIQTVQGKDFSFVRTVTISSKKEKPGIHLNLSQRLGKCKSSIQDSPLAASRVEGAPFQKKSLSERLGRKASPSAMGSNTSPKKVQVPRPLKERLGLPTEQNSAETEKAVKPAAEFRIKTLEEIRQEKARQRLENDQAGPAPRTEDPPTGKRVTRPQSRLHVKTFAEVQAEKRRQQLKEMMQNTGGQALETANTVNHLGVKQVTPQVEAIRKFGRQDEQFKLLKLQKEVKLEMVDESVTAASSKSANQISTPSLTADKSKDKHQFMETVKIKTLEEIRREKALRLKQVTKPQNEQNEGTVCQPQAPVKHKVPQASKPEVNTETKREIEPSSLSSEIHFTVDPAKDCFKMHGDLSASIPQHSQEKKQEAASPVIYSDNMETELAVNAIPDATVKTRITVKKTRAKPKVNVEPRVVKNCTSTKRAIKRKTQESVAVAAVRPLNSAMSSPVMDQTSNPESSISAADSALTKNTSVSDVLPKRQKLSLEASAPEPVCPSTARSPTPKNTPVLTEEDDFDDLIWDMSEEKMEDEIQLDPGKDEDELLLELSEMIDS